MNAQQLAGLNGRLAIALRAARTAGAVGSDEELTNAILVKHGANEVDIRPLLTRLRRATAPRARPGEKVRHGFT
jgi:hypothetical protein